jgi:uncharacterized protein
VVKKIGNSMLYLLAGVYFGIVATKSQIISWYRIQEMFLFDAFHMYGIIASAVAVGAWSIYVLERLGARSLDRQPISVPDKTMATGARYWLGGLLFGFGWGLVGACPGPIFALLGNGFSVVLVVLASAMAGTWAYAVLQPRLPQ